MFERIRVGLTLYTVVNKSMVLDNLARKFLEYSKETDLGIYHALDYACASLLHVF
jgi:hypothetical protein